MQRQTSVQGVKKTRKLESCKLAEPSKIFKLTSIFKIGINLYFIRDVGARA
jgi:hypothetical protein